MGLDDVTREALAGLGRGEGADGLWRTPYLGGPLHTASGLIATALLGAPSRARFDVEHELLEGILATQQSDGSLPAYPGGPCLRATARVVELACRVFVRTYASFLTTERQGTIVAAADAARRFAEDAESSGLFSELVANLLWNAVHPDEPDWLGASLAAEAGAVLLAEPEAMIARRWLSSFARQAVPAIAVLMDTAANRSVAEQLGTKILDWLRIDPDAAAKRALERHILENQAKTGGWLWSVFGTVLNLLALRALGRRGGDEVVDRGIAFIDGLRMDGGAGRLVQSWCNAEIWDTSVAGTTLIAAGMPPAGLERAVELVLAEQQADGLWAFGIGALEGDNDSSAMTLTFLARASKLVGAELRARAEDACTRCAEALMSDQREDGGFGYSPAPYEEPYGFGRRLPFGIETALVDASTADVTGRVMTALLGAATVGSPALEARVRTSVARAIGFLQSSQCAPGSWPGRWTCGYLSSLAFVLPPIRAFSPSTIDEAWIARCREFVLAHRNADGGWGETTLADSRPDDAGEGTSTPVQTAYATIALVATSARAAADDALRGAVRFLDGRATHGQWHNDRALYTVAFREDYFDAPFMTNAMVTSSLLYAQDAADRGVDAATDLLIRG